MASNNTKVQKYLQFKASIPASLTQKQAPLECTDLNLQSIEHEL